MPTVTEIKYSYLTYCQKWDVHCPCLSCCNASKKIMLSYCEICSGHEAGEYIEGDTTERGNILDCGDLKNCMVEELEKK